MEYLKVEDEIVKGGEGEEGGEEDDRRGSYLEARRVCVPREMRYYDTSLAVDGPGN